MHTVQETLDTACAVHLQEILAARLTQATLLTEAERGEALQLATSAVGTRRARKEALFGAGAPCAACTERVLHVAQALHSKVDALDLWNGTDHEEGGVR